MISLRRKTVGGVIWTSLETGGQYIIQLLITIILARLLAPKDFGIIELLAIFSGLSKVIIDSGFSQALIRKKDAIQIDYVSVFYFNIVIALAIYVLLYFTSPAIAAFYRFPDLKNIARVVFITFVINAFGVVQNAKINRDLKFNILAKRSIIAAILSGIIGIVLAFLGFGVWALVFQQLLMAFFNVALLWIFSKWMPSGPVSLKPIRSMIGFSGNLVIGGVLDVLVSNIQSVMIGKFYSKPELGQYAQAKRFETVPSTSITKVIQSVIYPVLSKIHDDTERLRNGYRKIISIAVLLVVPLMFLFIGTADNLFYVILSEKWIPAVAYFRPLCLMGALFPLYNINLNIFTVKGRSDLYLKIEITKRIITLTLVSAGAAVSVLALVWGTVTATLLNTLVTMIFSGRLIAYKMKQQILDVAKIWLISVAMGAVTYGLGVLLRGEPRIIRLGVQLVVGGIFFLPALYLFDRQKIILVKEIITEIKTR